MAGTDNGKKLCMPFVDHLVNQKVAFLYLLAWVSGIAD